MYMLQKGRPTSTVLVSSNLFNISFNSQKFGQINVLVTFDLHLRSSKFKQNCFDKSKNKKFLVSLSLSCFALIKYVSKLVGRGGLQPK